MTAHAAIKNTFLEDFSVQKCLTIILASRIVQNDLDTDFYLCYTTYSWVIAPPA